jgi:hypothetical protein
MHLVVVMLVTVGGFLLFFTPLTGLSAFDALLFSAI